MSIDPVPENHNHIASLLGRIFHPAIVAIPTQLIILSEIGWNEALRWSLLVLPIVLVPGLIAIFILERRGRMAYQRKTRTPLYIVAWISVIISLLLVISLQG